MQPVNFIAIEYLTGPFLNCNFFFYRHTCIGLLCLWVIFSKGYIEPYLLKTFRRFCTWFYCFVYSRAWISMFAVFFFSNYFTHWSHLGLDSVNILVNAPPRRIQDKHVGWRSFQWKGRIPISLFILSISLIAYSLFVCLCVCLFANSFKRGSKGYFDTWY